ncbi:MAG TPA: MotA/TolQ/ExbB proton channel family protein, partial [Candidatus Dormibacteraeota bacterium]|nr:MotA/TolQ/ExbB proton channel family protein [Candidatus Dormibacteraeota bacterium]
MVEAILSLFISEERTEILVSNPMIEFIFLVLFVSFVVALFIHLVLFNKLKKIRNYLKDTHRMDIEPLDTMKEQFEKSQLSESISTETFVQEKFSGWRMFHVPVVNLIKMIQMTVSIFILLGVLGTFIGLTISLGSIDASGSQLVENVVGVLAGIDMAFYTSIAGMGLSLVMTVLIKVLNTEYLLTDIMLKVESTLTGNEEGSISRLIDVSETINHSILELQETNRKSLGEIVGAFAGFQEYTTGLQKSAEDLAQFNDGLSSNLQDFQELFHNMSDVTDGFSEGTTALNDNFKTLFQYFKKMDGRNEQLAKRFEHIYEKVKEVATTQMDTLSEFE